MPAGVVSPYGSRRIIRRWRIRRVKQVIILAVCWGRKPGADDGQCDAAGHDAAGHDAHARGRRCAARSHGAYKDVESAIGCANGGSSAMSLEYLKAQFQLRPPHPVASGSPR